MAERWDKIGVWGPSSCLCGVFSLSSFFLFFPISGRRPEMGSVPGNQDRNPTLGISGNFPWFLILGKAKGLQLELACLQFSFVDYSQAVMVRHTHTHYHHCKQLKARSSHCGQKAPRSNCKERSSIVSRTLLPTVSNKAAPKAKTTSVQVLCMAHLQKKS